MIPTKISEVDLDFMKGYMRVELDNTEDDIEIQSMMESAKHQIQLMTHWTPEEMDTMPGMVNFYCQTVAHYYGSRSNAGEHTFGSAYDRQWKLLKKKGFL